MLTTSPILKLEDLDKEFNVCTHACLEGLGGVLVRENFLIAYESRKLTGHDKNYVVRDLELAVVIHALKMWRHYLLGKRYMLLTYLFSLNYLFSQPDLNARQARWMTFLSEFDFAIKHTKGKENKVANDLSRHAHNLTEIVVSSIKIDFVEQIKNSVHKDFKYL